MHEDESDVDNVERLRLERKFLCYIRQLKLDVRRQGPVLYTNSEYQVEAGSAANKEDDVNPKRATLDGLTTYVRRKLTGQEAGRYLRRLLQRQATL